MSNKKVFLFFPGQERLGGAERRIIRSFCKIKKTDPDFDFVVGLLAVGKINHNYVRELYSSLGEFDLIIFDKKMQIFNHVRKQKYTCVVYTDCSFRCLPVLFAATISKKRKYMLCVDTIGSSQNLKPSLRQILYNLDIKMSDRIDCLYPSNTKELKERFKNKTISCTACSFTDMDRFTPLFPKEKTITFLGRLQEDKGIRLFVDSAIEIAEEIRKKGFVCKIYGSGVQKDEIENIIKETHCEDIIHLCGQIEDSADVLRVSTIFCSLQKYGNYPSQSLLEALACGNYCIVTDTADSHLLINDNYGALIKQERAALSKALIQAMDIPIDRYKQISESSRAFLYNNHSLEKSAEYYNKLLDS